MSDYRPIARLVPNPTVLLQSDNWHDFSESTLARMQSASNLDLMIRDPRAFKIQYQDVVEEQEDIALKLDIESASIQIERDTRDRYYQDALQNFTVTIRDVKQSITDGTADVAFKYIIGDKLLRWNEIGRAIQNNTAMDIADAPPQVNDVTYQGLKLAKEALDSSIQRLAVIASTKRRLAREQVLSNKSYVAAASSLEHEKSALLNQLFSKGTDALINQAYLEQLMGGSDGVKLMQLRSSRKLLETWEFLKALQEKTFPNAAADRAVAFMMMTPIHNEPLDTFNVRFMDTWKSVKSNPNHATFQNLVVSKYRDILRDHYGTPHMLRILEPYYQTVESPTYRPLPVDVFNLRDIVRQAMKTAFDVAGMPFKMLATRGHVVAAAVEEVVAAAATSGNPHPPQNRLPACFMCRGDHNTMLCRTVDQSKMKEMKDLALAMREDIKMKPTTAPTTAWRQPTTAPTTAWKPRSKKQHQPVVSSAVEELESESIFDQCLSVVEVIGAVNIRDQSYVQLDNGSNSNILNDRDFFDADPVPSDRSFVGVYADSPRKLGMVGDARGLGRSYFDVNARNILSQSRLEEEGYDLAMIKDPRSPHITRSWILSKSGHRVTFDLCDGIFYASKQEVMKMLRNLNPEVIAVTTRGNPMGIPNNTMLSTTMPPPTIETVDDAMEVIEEPSHEYELPHDLLQSDVHTYNQGLELHTPELQSHDVHMYTDGLELQVSSNEHSVAQNVSNERLQEEIHDDSLQDSIKTTTRDPFYVPSLGRRLTRAEETKYGKAANLHVATGHAGKATEIQLLQGAHLLNTDLTPNDVRIYHEISGTCLGCVKGKFTMPKQLQWEIRTGALIGEYWELDNGFFGDKAYLILVEVVTNYVIVYPLASRKATAIHPIALQWLGFLTKTFPRLFDTTVDGSPVTIKVRSDREAAFNVFASVVRPVQMSRTSAEGHASRVEVFIRILKERARSIMYSLPYRLPSSRFNDLINYIIDVKNYLPSTVKATSTPMEVIFSKRLREDDLLRLQFGQMVATIVPPSQRGPKSDAVAQEGIIVGFEPHTPTNIKIYIPATNHIVSRCKIIKIHSPALIKILNDMSRMDIIVDPFPLTDSSSDLNPDIIVTSTVEGGLPRLLTHLDLSTCDNMNMAQAIKVFGKERVIDSTLSELDNMSKMGVFKFVDPNVMTNGKQWAMPSKIFYKAKTKDGAFDKLKARIVSRGDLQPAGSYGETRSPTADKASLFMLCALNKVIKGNIYSVDVPAAFLFAQLKEHMYMRLPKEITDLVINARKDLAKFRDHLGRLTVQLMKSLYGLKQSPLNWFHHLVRVLEDSGFEGCITDRCVFYKKDVDGSSHLVFHVDDIFVSSNSTRHIDDLKTSFSKAFGPMDWAERQFTFLGMFFCLQEDFSIDIDMAAYTVDLVDKHWTEDIGKEFKKSRGIINPSSDTLFHDVDICKDVSSKEISKYKSITMELLYLTTVRVDILKECIIAAGQSHAPGPKSWKLIRQLIAYLKENPSYVINLGADNTTLTMYADAGYAQHPDARSHTGIYITLGDNAGPIVVKSKKQSLVTQSSTEAELCALVDGVKKAIPLAKLLVELKLNNTLFISARQDNTSTITIARMGEGMTGKAKHFLVRFHFAKELQDKGTLEVSYTSTDKMIPDFQTKGMTGVKLQYQLVRAMYHSDVSEFIKANARAIQRVIANKATSVQT